MRAIACGILMLFTSVTAHAQTYGDVQIRFGVFDMKPDGGERPTGVWRTGLVIIGKPLESFFSFGDTCEAWAVSSQPSIREDATTAWKIETTPLRVEKNAVTLRLRWVRLTALKQQLDQVSLDEAKAARLPSDDVELTLRPGESWEVDRVRVPAGSKTVQGKICGPSASIRLSIDNRPGAEEDHRLVAADLWLVERLPGGGEAQRSQLLNVRGLPNRPFRFYFDSIVDGDATLDIYGILTARPETGALTVSLETRSRWAPEKRNISGPQGFLNSLIQMKPAETVEIRLPPFGDEAGVFAKRSLSIRIRARQVR